MSATNKMRATILMQATILLRLDAVFCAVDRFRL